MCYKKQNGSWLASGVAMETIAYLLRPPWFLEKIVGMIDLSVLFCENHGLEDLTSAVFSRVLLSRNKASRATFRAIALAWMFTTPVIKTKWDRSTKEELRIVHILVCLLHIRSIAIHTIATYWHPRTRTRYGREMNSHLPFTILIVPLSIINKYLKIIIIKFIVW